MGNSFTSLPSCAICSFVFFFCMLWYLRNSGIHPGEQTALPEYPEKRLRVISGPSRSWEYLTSPSAWKACSHENWASHCTLRGDGSQGPGEAPDGQTQWERPCGCTEATPFWVPLEKVWAEHGSWALPQLCGGCGVPAPSPSLPLFSCFPIQTPFLGLFFSL